MSDVESVSDFLERERERKMHFSCDAEETLTSTELMRWSVG